MSLKRATKSATAAGHETTRVANQGVVSFSATDANGDFAGTLILKRTYDSGSNYETVWSATYAAGELPVYKTVWCADVDASYVLEADVWTAGTGIELTVTSVPANAVS